MKVLHSHLEMALKQLQQLIELTECDIEDIKLAKHTEIFERNSQKQVFIQAFEKEKVGIDSQMINLKNQFPHKEMSELLDEHANNLLSQMRETLLTLKEKNTAYSRMAFAVSEFYSSLMQQIIPHDTCDYKGARHVGSHFLRVQA
ncbi:hypothetical protein [Helicobacter cetorum]|uniref:Flagellar protein FlgN n=1 Tax=Helicobacter cetorum (strain ATCC BAA-429 / MIT 00-7128) TaxID=182217 RepID=I0EPQ7_HELC0|nr:hypothetical protein [Helicobacter cetorum]AFI04926.1 hypothetical protein HCW_08345 [Helicobacter cetorum MIT 00-7128]